MQDRRRCTTVRQLEILVEFLEGHLDLALGRMRSKEARAVSVRLWHDCTELLNVAGPARSAKEWAKVWNDMKCRIRAKLAHIKSQQAAGGGPNSPATLTPLEDRIVNSILRRDVPQNQFVVSNDDDIKVAGNEVVVDNSETQNVSQEMIIQIEEIYEEARPESADSPIPSVIEHESADSPIPSVTEHIPSSPPIHRRRIKGQRRTERARHQHTARAPAQSYRTALEEHREMVLRVETLRAEAALRTAEASLRNAEALSAFAEGFRLIAGSIDRFSQMFCQQRGERD